jgi:dTDP-4-amino-4,6-dideoxygalactose transaminase
MLSYKRYLSFTLLKRKNRRYSLQDYLPYPSTGLAEKGNRDNHESHDSQDNHGSQNNLYFVGSGRGAMEAIIDGLKLTSADAVLIPAMVPEGLISPLRKKNLQVAIYKSNDDMSVDLADLEQQLQQRENIKAVVIIHFFGYPQDTRNILDLCRKYDVLLIEDCAQALLSKDGDGTPLGGTGDISFFSLPKTIPVPDGAAICFNITGPPLKINHRRSIFHLLAVGFHVFYLLAKKWELKMKDSLLYRLINFGSRVMYAFYYQALRWTPKPTRISRTTKKIIASIDYDSIIAKRSANTDYFYRHIDRNKFHLNYPSYNKNYILTGIPIRSDHREEIVRQLKKNGIECLSYVKRWYLLSQESTQRNEKEFENEKNFYHRHFLVPVSENIGLDDMRTIVNTLNNS